MAETALQIDSLTHVFTTRNAALKVLDSVSLDVRSGEFFTIVGPSGCGKSTLLNFISGLLKPTAGQVRVQGAPVNEPSRQVGYITQKDTLLPWRNTISNVALPLELYGVGARERTEKAAGLLAQVGLKGFEHHYPRELSGGMRQRARIVRTFSYDPEIILMDEPFGALDAQTRSLLQNQLLEFWEAHRKTVLFITHDLVEAIALSDRVAVMTARPGRMKAVFDIPIPRPRDVLTIHSDETFRELYDQIMHELRSEVATAAASEGF